MLSTKKQFNQRSEVLFVHRLSTSNLSSNNTTGELATHLIVSWYDEWFTSDAYDEA